jgi:hypothetical protein
MKVTIFDKDALRAISPSALAAYARSEGWHKTETYGAHSDVYGASNRPEIVLPRTDRLGDYQTIVSKLLAIFAKVAGRDEMAMYRDLVGADRDTIRVRSSGNDDDGTILIDAGVKVVSQAREMLLAAACAALTPQTVFRAGANQRAVDYMRRVRLGQTEHGSFVVSLLAPVPLELRPPPEPPVDLAWPDVDDEPYERRVTRCLATSLDASRTAVEGATAGNPGAFDGAVGEGVSANLCEAVSSLAEQSGSVEISITWAKTRPTPEARRTITFTSSDAGILREAARVFRARLPRTDVELSGTVHQLKREDGEATGDITLNAFIDGQLRSVRAILGQTDYGAAIQAHERRTPILLGGDLERVGERWRLNNATVIGRAPGVLEEA